MRKYLIEKLKALRQLFVSCRSYSFIEWVHTIGAFLLMMYIPLLIGFIWVDAVIILRVVAANTVLLALGIWIVDHPPNGN
jgi:hypothetical protein